MGKLEDSGTRAPMEASGRSSIVWRLA
jgi:hypothetical protein